MTIVASAAITTVSNPSELGSDAPFSEETPSLHNRWWVNEAANTLIPLGLTELRIIGRQQQVLESWSIHANRSADDPLCGLDLTNESLVLVELDAQRLLFWVFDESTGGLAGLIVNKPGYIPKVKEKLRSCRGWLKILSRLAVELSRSQQTGARLLAELDQRQQQDALIAEERKFAVSLKLAAQEAMIEQQRQMMDKLEHEVAIRTSDLRLQTRQLEATNQRMRQALEGAAKIQRSMLPTSLPVFRDLRFGWLYRPTDELAGDSLNVFRLDEHHVGVYVLDVSGHGVAAALLSVTLSRLLTPTPGGSLVKPKDAQPPGYRIAPPMVVASELNRRFRMDDSNQQYFTLFYGVLDIRTRRLTYVSAGHPDVVLLTPGETPTFIQQPGFAIGWFPEADFEQHELILPPKSRLFIYSDGLPDALNSFQEEFGKDRLSEAAADMADMPLDQAVERMEAVILAWADQKPHDDLSLLAIEVD